jgi:hypothetical protein
VVPRAWPRQSDTFLGFSVSDASLRVPSHRAVCLGFSSARESCSAELLRSLLPPSSPVLFSLPSQSSRRRRPAGGPCQRRPVSLMRDPSRRRIYGRSWFARRCYMLYIYVLPGFNGVACTVCHPTRTASQQYHVCHMFFFKIARSPVLYCTVLAYHRFSVSNTPGTIPKLRRSVLGSCNSPQYFLLLG